MDLSALQNGSDIRGYALGPKANLTPEVIARLSAAFMVWLRLRKGRRCLRISIGMDSRLSGPKLKQAAAQALANAGATVLDCGISSTPAMFISTIAPAYQCDGAIMLTASHLPKDRNGMKFFTKDGGLTAGDIRDILLLARHPIIERGFGRILPSSFLSVYADSLVRLIRAETGEQTPLDGMRIIVDAGNGTAGFFVDQVLEPLGADTQGSQYLEPDGRFLHHPPNPENAEAMQSLVDAVKTHGADFGFIFDTDVDRMGAVDHTGLALNKNKLIAVTSALLLRKTPGATIVTDSVTSTGLHNFILSKGGIHHRFKRGYQNVIREAVRLTGEGQYAPLAIETSGHAAFLENHFQDDGTYLAARLLIELATLRKTGQTVADLLDGFEEPASSQEFRLAITTEDFHAYGQRLLQALEAYAKTQPAFHLELDNYEGVRAWFDKDHGAGWFLLRLSLHEPLLALNIESDLAGGDRAIASQVLAFLQSYAYLDLQPLESFASSC